MTIRASGGSWTRRRKTALVVAISLSVTVGTVFIIADQRYPQIRLVSRDISCQNGVVTYEFNLVNDGPANGYATVEFRFMSPDAIVVLASSTYLVRSGETVSVNRTITDSLGCRPNGVYSADITLQARA
jgi:hypothetical protein